MSDTDTTAVTAVADFITRWERSGAAERANYQLFLSELCDLLGVPRPEPATDDDARNVYVFERAVVFQHADGTNSSGRIDLYKRGCLVLEAKQGAPAADPTAAPPLSAAACASRGRLKTGTARRGTAAWDDAMLRARAQGERYIRALPATEGRPPFLLVVDVGHPIELFAEFSCTGGAYLPFPAPGSHRLFLRDLERPEIRARLRLVWTTPHELDPTRRSARVTREIAGRLARLAVSLEARGHEPHAVAAFLMRCLFTMFAEDVGLLARNGFSNLLKSVRETPEHFGPLVEELWLRMDRGGFSTSLRTAILQFNGGLFENATALPVTQDELQLLIEASQADWRDVEPAIFGTLLERALNPVERHKLGAHYTPRAYVERLVIPTIVEPVRAEWAAVHAAAVTLANADDLPRAAVEARTFHRKLCHIRVLDPACGSGNFLYVTLEHLKRIEGEVFDLLDTLGEKQTVLEMAGETVGPHQLLGLEINPRAAAIAELVLWIGTLQGHFRNRGSVRPPQPIIRNFRNIQCRDALLDYDGIAPLLDDSGAPVTRWDGRTCKPHPVTGLDVPDDTARVPVASYINPRAADWPEADYIVGNPPFIGNKRMRLSLGDGYVDAVRTAWRTVTETADFVMYWYRHALDLLANGRILRFGFIATNSVAQTFNRATMQAGLDVGARIAFAVPDHPWVDNADGAQVRVAMTVFDREHGAGALWTVRSETPAEDGSFDVTLAVSRGAIFADLETGVNTATLVSLHANKGLACPGVQLSGQGFALSADQALLFGKATRERLLRRYVTGRDVTQHMREQYVLDTFGLGLDELLGQFPDAFNWLHEHVKPEREQNPREKYRREWWIHAEPRGKFRSALTGLLRFVGTSRTARHRTFQFLPAAFLPETKVLILAFDDAFHIGVLSSRIHVAFANRTGGWLGVGNDSTYNHSVCFETFPFPAATEAQRQRIRDLAEQLDAHRKGRQAEHADLTMTGMYNVLEKLRTGATLTAVERTIHAQGLVAVLRQLHDDLDAAVCDAYDWPATLSDDGILERLVALNAERAAEEARGLVRWLRPSYQVQAAGAPTTAAAGSAVAAQAQLAIPAAATPPPATTRLPWPSALPEQVRAVRACLTAASAPLNAAALARRFTRARVPRIAEILATLVALGQAREAGGDMYVAG